MNFNSKRNVSDEQNERHKRLLASILKEEGNKSCADCRTRNPTWASVNLGVFVCLTCSGIHRSLGVHISQVRSCNLDTWLPKQVEFCRVMGNAKGNRYWEARLPKEFRRPPSGNPNPDLAAFIRAKYEDRAFAATDVPQPPTIDSYLDHPYAKEDEPAAPAAAPASLRSTPTKQSASSPALTMDLLGGFDELAGGATPVAAASSLLLAPPASSDPFGFGSFVSAAPSASSLAPQRNSLEWTDFHAAAPPSSSASSPVAAAAAAAHQRSYSDSAPAHHAAAASTASPQPSRLSNHTNSSSLLQEDQRRQQHQPQPQHPHPHPHQPLPDSNHHNHHGHHPSHHGGAHAAGAQHGGGRSADPFGTAISEDLLAGLTIHHVMESLHQPPAAASTSASAIPAASDPFSFSSSATDHAMPPPGAGHKRHPSHVKRPSGEEVLRLFDAVPSSDAAALATVGSDDPFGDFLSAGHVGQPNGAKHAHAANGLGGDLL